MAPRALSLYIHWPFCISKCPYCDFNSHVAASVDYEAWAMAYMKEMEYFAQRHFPKNTIIKTIFFGGGTPSLMPTTLVDRILKKVSDLWQLNDDIEITLEANPSSFEVQKFKDFKLAGINRISIGVQSLIEAELKALGRMHGEQEARSAIIEGSKIFDRLSFDLIYARSGQTLSSWQNELKEAMELAKGHISLYQLTIEKGTPFYSLHRSGKLTIPEQEIAAEMYDWTNDYLKSQGYDRYEISNYAAKDQECRHNLAYWNYDEYLGIGPGAHSRIMTPKAQRSALMMIHKPEAWLNAVKENEVGTQSATDLTKAEIIEEVLMMGLRLRNGISLKKIEELTGSSHQDILDHKACKLYQDNGLLAIDDDKISLTDEGLKLHSYIVPRIILGI